MRQYSGAGSGNVGQSGMHIRRPRRFRCPRFSRKTFGGGAAPCPLLLAFLIFIAVLAVPAPTFAANVSFSIPTNVELKVKADDTVVAPSAEA